MFSFISSHRTVHIHNAVNTVCFMFTHPVVAGELQKAEMEPKHPTYSANPHISFPCTPSWPHSRSTTLQHDSLFCANIVEFSNYQWVVIFYCFFCFFFTAEQTAKIFHKYLNRILLYKRVVNVHAHLLKTLLEGETIVTEIFLDMIHSFSWITWTRHAYPIGSGSRNTFSSGLKRDWFPNELSIKTFGNTSIQSNPILPIN